MAQATLPNESPAAAGETPLTGAAAGGPDQTNGAEFPLDAGLEQDTFSYKPLPLAAPVGFFLGLASGLSLLTVVVLPLCVAAGAVCWFALRRIRAADGELGGGKLAKTGLVCAVLFFVGGTAWHSSLYATEVPEGYTRVTFNRDISRKEFVFKDGVRELHPDVAPLEDQKIYIKGYMWNVRKQSDLSGFILLKDNGECCFGGNPKPFDFMEVEMPAGKTTDAMDGMIAVAGTLRCHPDQPTVYVLEADLVERARSPF